MQHCGQKIKHCRSHMSTISNPKKNKQSYMFALHPAEPVLYRCSPIVWWPKIGFFFKFAK